MEDAERADQLGLSGKEQITGSSGLKRSPGAAIRRSGENDEEQKGAMFPVRKADDYMPRAL